MPLEFDLPNLPYKILFGVKFELVTASGKLNTPTCFAKGSQMHTIFMVLASVTSL